MYLVIAILIFSFLIFIHEFGHFITAKLFDVKVNEFSIFMGPRILHWVCCLVSKRICNRSVAASKFHFASL